MKKRIYYKFSDYLRERFGCRVYKVSIDAGFSCPNRDGTIGNDGCIFCDNKGFSYNTRIPTKPINKQIQHGIEFGRKRFKAKKFIVYFQAYTNTYGELSDLKRKYDVIDDFKDVVGLSVGTRPDCINEDILELINSYRDRYELWIEYGLQSIHEKTLKKINRGHNYKDFLDAVKITRENTQAKICVHIIIGLPGESQEMMLETAKELGRLKIEGIKIHPLHMIKNTKLEDMYKKNIYKEMSIEEYTSKVSLFLEYLNPETIVQRVTATCPKEFLVAPSWINERNKILKMIEHKMKSSARYQGISY